VFSLQNDFQQQNTAKAVKKLTYEIDIVEAYQRFCFFK